MHPLETGAGLGDCVVAVEDTGGTRLPAAIILAVTFQFFCRKIYFTGKKNVFQHSLNF